MLRSSPRGIPASPLRRVAMWAALLVALPGAAIAALSGNLIVNGGAETGDLSGWSSVAGTATVVGWSAGGGFPTTGSPGPPDRGVYFIAGGCCAVLSQIRQTIDISGGSGPIDANAVSFHLSAYLGGFGGQENDAVLTIIFRDGSDAAIGDPVSIGPVSAEDRQSTTGLLLREAFGKVPANTRSVRVDLVMNGDGFYNDGYADDLSLVFVPDDAVGLNVDGSANGLLSDGNGVLEPGEAVKVEPSWKNSTGSAEPATTGTASGFTGPPDSDYVIDDNAATYGTIGAGATVGCATSANCYVLEVTQPTARPTTHWDATFQEALTTADPSKTWTLHIGDSFTDVPRSQPFYKKIETLLHAGITAGCTGTTYCPGDAVNRGQMAIFIAKGLAGGGANVPVKGTLNGQPYDCESFGTSQFSDVSPLDLFCKHVHYIATKNVTLGCATGMYCPSGNVTRLEMASFIAKALVAPAGGPGIPATYGPDPVTGLSYSCSVGSPSIHFTDVPASNAFCKHVHYLWAKGVIAGCSATTYCPGENVTRDAMAKFLSNAFHLVLYGP